MKRSDCIQVYGSTIEDDVVKRSDCIQVYGSTIDDDVVKRSDCIQVYESTIEDDVVKRSDCIQVYGSTHTNTHTRTHTQYLQSPQYLVDQELNVFVGQSPSLYVEIEFDKRSSRFLAIFENPAQST